ncbi:hypothetical protein [Thiofilum flexile]|uniref:hypothetical protein n=1 Tax=Thiofilum flexile TaxID=125627 RepID=UPI000365C4BE|nr:hypothetical protein [Thiofilum flexile]
MKRAIVVLLGLMYAGMAAAVERPVWCDNVRQSPSEATVCGDEVLATRFLELDKRWDAYKATQAEDLVKVGTAYFTRWNREFFQPCKDNKACSNVAIEMALNASFFNESCKKAEEFKPKPVTKAEEFKPEPVTKAEEFKPDPLAKAEEFKPEPVTKAEEFKPEPIAKAEEFKFDPLVKPEDFKPEPVTKTEEFKPEPVTKTDEFKPEPVTKAEEEKPDSAGKAPESVVERQKALSTIDPPAAVLKQPESGKVQSKFAPTPAETIKDKKAPALDIPQIVLSSKADVDRLLGTASHCEKVKYGNKCYYQPMSTEIVFIDGKADWITVNNLESAVYDKSALKLMGLEPMEPDISNESVIAWKNKQGLLEVLLFPASANKVFYAFIKAKTR